MLKEQQLNKKKVLLAESNKKAAQELTKLFNKEGYQVEVVRETSAIIEKLQQEKFDLLILDTQMPQLKGYEILPLIKGVDSNLPVIVTASQSSSGLEAKIRRQKVFYYHLKSFGLEELKLAVKSALEKVK